MSIFEKKKRGRKLKDIDVDEISLVDKAATGKAFFVIKKEGLGIVDRLEKLIPQDDEEREIIKKIGEAFPADLRPALEESLDTLIEYQFDLTPDLAAASAELVCLGLGSAGQGPDEAIEPALEEIKKVAAEYESDMNPALKSALIYFYKMAADGLEGFQYELEDPEEDPEGEEEEGAYVSKYGSDFVPGQPVEENEEVRLAKSKQINWPSLCIAETETKPGPLSIGKQYIGKSIFAGVSEDPEEDPIEKKRPKSKGLLSDDEDPEEIEKAEEDEFQWTSLCSSGE
jgi:hypothetical protein